MTDNCKFYDCCPLAKPEYTCTHQDDAKGFCGRYKENEKHGLLKFQKRYA